MLSPGAAAAWALFGLRSSGRFECGQASGCSLCGSSGRHGQKAKETAAGQEACFNAGEVSHGQAYAGGGIAGVVKADRPDRRRFGANYPAGSKR